MNFIVLLTLQTKLFTFTRPCRWRFQKLNWRGVPLNYAPKVPALVSRELILFQGLWSLKRTLSKIWMKNRPVSNSQNSYITSKAWHGKAIHGFIHESQCNVFFFMPLASEPIVNFNNSKLAYCSFKYWTLFLKKKRRHFEPGEVSTDQKEVQTFSPRKRELDNIFR